jgi:hypothetical protein
MDCTRKHKSSDVYQLFADKVQTKAMERAQGYKYLGQAILSNRD